PVPPSPTRRSSDLATPMPRPLPGEEACVREVPRVKRSPGEQVDRPFCAPALAAEQFAPRRGERLGRDGEQQEPRKSRGDGPSEKGTERFTAGSGGAGIDFVWDPPERTEHHRVHPSLKAGIDLRNHFWSYRRDSKQPCASRARVRAPRPRVDEGSASDRSREGAEGRLAGGARSRQGPPAHPHVRNDEEDGP